MYLISEILSDKMWNRVCREMRDSVVDINENVFYYSGNKNADLDLNKKGNKVGFIEVHLYRPFSVEYLNKVLPETTKKIAEVPNGAEKIYFDGENIYSIPSYFLFV